MSATERDRSPAAVDAHHRGQPTGQSLGSRRTTATRDTADTFSQFGVCGVIAAPRTDYLAGPTIGRIRLATRPARGRVGDRLAS